MDSTPGLRVVDAEHADRQQQELYYRNRSQSGLLALPLEIRWRIFELILKNKHIHIREKRQPRTPHTFLLQTSEPPPDYVCRNSSSHFRSVLNEGMAAATPNWASIEPMTPLTPVWRTCRQLYHETVHMIRSETNVVSVEIPSVRVVAPLLSRHLTKFWIHDLFQVEEWFRLFFKQDKNKNWVLKKEVTEIWIPSRLHRLRQAARTGRSDMRVKFDADAEEAKLAYIRRKFAPIPTIVVEV